MNFLSLSPARIRSLIKQGRRMPLATAHYPSRGQTAIQELYLTSAGKLFLKKASRQNHVDCRISIKDGTLAEREYWSFSLASRIGLGVPSLCLLDRWTTVQLWLDYPDGRQYATSQGRMELTAENVFDCGVYDWLTGQIDRHDANYLYDYVNRKIILIDSAHCFLKYEGSLPDYLRFFEIGYPGELGKKRRSLLQKMLVDLSEDALAGLVPLRNHEEGQALTRRHARIKSIHSIGDIIHLYRGEKK